MKFLVFLIALIVSTGTPVGADFLPEPASDQVLTQTSADQTAQQLADPVIDNSAQLIDLFAAPGLDEDAEAAEIAPVSDTPSTLTSFLSAAVLSYTPANSPSSTDSDEAQSGRADGVTPSQEQQSGSDQADSDSQQLQSDTQQPQSGQQDVQNNSEQPEPDQAEADSETLRQTDTGYQVVTAPMQTEPFYVAGVTWSGPSPQQVDVRVLENGSWTDWFNLEIEEEAEGGNPGTEAFITSGATGIQVRLAGTTIPTDLDLALTSGGTQDVESVVPDEADVQPVAGSESDIAANASFNLFVPTSNFGTTVQAGFVQTKLNAETSYTGATVAEPDVISRADWGESRVPTDWEPEYVPLTGAIIHHTAGTNDYTEEEAPEIVRAIHDFHTYSWGRGWDDIGYNFLIDKYGNIYEGRYGSLLSEPGQMVIGGHAAPANTNSVGISVMGTYTDAVMPSQTVVDTIEQVTAWQFSMAGIDPNGTRTYRDNSGTYQTISTIAGHRDVSATICPGNIYDFLPQIRQDVAAALSAASRSVAQVTYRAGATYYFNNAWSGQADNVFVQGVATSQALVGDWDGDGVDTLALRLASAYGAGQALYGNIFDFYPSNSTSTSTRLAYGKTGDQVLVGDWDGDGVDTLAVRRGNAFYIKNSIAGGQADQVVYYGRANDTVLVGDWDGDGVDTLAVRRGANYYIADSIKTGVADRIIAYGRAGDEVFVGDWDGDGVDTFAVRRGNAFYVSNASKSGVAEFVQPYGKVSDQVVVGDWDADGMDTLGVRR